jgi:hypothetical protein
MNKQQPQCALLKMPRQPKEFSVAMAQLQVVVVQAALMPR